MTGRKETQGKTRGHAPAPLSAPKTELKPEPVSPEPVNPLAALTPRRREVAGLIAHGFSNRQIAERIGRTENTVEKHVGAIMRGLRLDPSRNRRLQVAHVVAGLKERQLEPVGPNGRR
jgi:DNA-binding NarL/FixJ family response regulator